MTTDTHRQINEEKKNETVIILSEVDVTPYENDSPLETKEKLKFNDNHKSNLIESKIERKNPAEEQRYNRNFGKCKEEKEKLQSINVPKSVVWLENTKPGGKEIIDQPKRLVYRTPLDEVIMKQRGFVDSHCHRLRENEPKMEFQIDHTNSDHRSIVNKHKDTGKVAAKPNFSISPNSGELLVSLQDIPPFKIKMDINQFIKKLRSQFKSMSNRKASRLLLSIKGTIAVTETCHQKQ